MPIKFLTTIGLAALAASVSAQEMPYIDYNGALDHARTTGRMVRQAQARQNRSAEAISPRNRATCLNKRRVAARLTATKARRLYALCARAGY